MLKNETLNLIMNRDITYVDFFSICIGKSFTVQRRLIDYLGQYSRWNTDINEGVLKLDDKSFDVDYMGTTSTADSFWYSAEIEKVIPDAFVNIMMNVRKTLQSWGYNKLAEPKILLDNVINAYDLAMIYCALAPQNVACYCGKGDTTIYMFMKNLPDELFKKINSNEFSTIVMEIISKFNINHKLMVEALLSENEIEYEINQNSVIAKFNEESKMTVEFGENGLITKVSGNLSL